MLSLVTSEDGSHTLLDTVLKEQYHSRHGAVSESMHVFINAGLRHVSSVKQNINILEVGFGTGLNAILTVKENSTLQKQICYHALEPFPVSGEIVSTLNYCALLGEQYRSAFAEMHRQEAGVESFILPGFSFAKHLNSISEWEAEVKYDLVYFDAFSPAIQPELWTPDIFSGIFHMLSEGASLVTYCAKGEVKRILNKVGFVVESLPGPLGKREMVRALKR